MKSLKPVNSRLLCMLALLALLVAAVYSLVHALPALAGVDDIRGAAILQETPLPTATPAPTRTPTAYPPEFLTNSTQTVGITLGGVILVMIVVVGVLVFMPKKNAA